MGVREAEREKVESREVEAGSAHMERRGRGEPKRGREVRVPRGKSDERE